MKKPSKNKPTLAFVEGEVARIVRNMVQNVADQNGSKAKISIGKHELRELKTEVKKSFLEYYVKTPDIQNRYMKDIHQFIQMQEKLAAISSQKYQNNIVIGSDSDEMEPKSKKTKTQMIPIKESIEGLNESYKIPKKKPVNQIETTQEKQMVNTEIQTMQENHSPSIHEMPFNVQHQYYPQNNQWQGNMNDYMQNQQYYGMQNFRPYRPKIRKNRMNPNWRPKSFNNYQRPPLYQQMEPNMNPAYFGGNQNQQNMQFRPQTNPYQNMNSNVSYGQ